MAISDTIQSMYENVGEVYDTITNVDLPTNKNIENIPSTIRKSYLDIMNNGIDKIYDNWEKVNGTGTSISLNNTEEAPMTIEYKGNTSQGENPTPTTPQDIHVVSGDNYINVVGKNLYNIEGQYETGTGITLTKNDDGSYTLNGTANGNNFFRGLCYLNEQHTISYTSSVANSNVIIRTRTGTPTAQTGIQDQLFVSSTSGNLTSSKQFDFVEISIPSGTTLNNFKIYIQLEKGNQVTDFQPHQSQNYEINLGKNLLDLPNNSITSNGVTSTITNGKLKIVGTTTTNWFSICNLNIPLESGTYIFSYTNKKVNRYNFSIKYEDNTTQVIYGNAYSNTPITLNKNATITSMFSDNNTTGATFDYEDYLMLEKGSQATSYSPYFTPIELCKIGDYQDRIFKSSGKNLFDSSSTSVYFINVSTGATQESNKWTQSDYVKVLPNTTYVMSASSTLGTGNIEYNEYNNSKIWIQGVQTGSTTESFKTFTTGNTTEYVRVGYRNDILTNIQLEEGTTATPYEPYGKVWYLHKETGKITFDGSENWGRSGNTSESFFCGALAGVNIPFKAKMGTAVDSKCNYFAKGNSHSNAEVFDMYNGTDYYTAFALYLSTSKVTDVTTFKNWLASNNTTLYYVLYQPTYEKITGELLNQLEAIKKSYENQTNINQENNDLPFELEVGALEKY